MKNRGTIVVLQRYVKALCFLDVFRWWYDSGTPEVRMRYADKFIDLSSKIENGIMYEGTHKSITDN